MLLVDELLQEHSELLGLAQEFEKVVLGHEPAPLQVSQLRWQMTRILCDHLAKEDRIFYPGLTACPNRKVAETARRFSAEMGGLSDSYRNYMTDWPIERIRDDWSGFQVESKQILAALRNRIQREENELFKLDAGEAERSGDMASRDLGCRDTPRLKAG